MSIYKHLLVATDLSQENEMIIERGLALAKSFNAKISFLHVIEPLPGYGYAYVGIADIEAELQAEAKKSMENLAEKHSVPIECCHIKVGPMKLELADLVKKEQVDCLVVGSHGRHGVSELLGSTAHTAVHSAPCDVITVRIKK